MTRKTRIVNLLSRINTSTLRKSSTKSSSLGSSYKNSPNHKRRKSPTIKSEFKNLVNSVNYDILSNNRKFENGFFNGELILQVERDIKNNRYKIKFDREMQQYLQENKPKYIKKNITVKKMVRWK
jgi:DUF917 family protein